MNYGAMDIHVQIFMWPDDLNVLEYIHRISMDHIILLHIIYIIWQSVHLYFITDMSLLPLQYTKMQFSLVLILVNYFVCLKLFIWTFFSYWEFFICLITTFIFSLEKYLCKVFICFLIKHPIFHLPAWQITYILCRCSLPDIWFIGTIFYKISFKNHFNFKVKSL